MAAIFVAYDPPGYIFDFSYSMQITFLNYYFKS